MANPRAIPPKSPATQFKPGADWTGNPGGRPKGESFQSILNAALASKHKNEPTWRHKLVVDAVLRADAGDLDALKWIIERTEGKATEKVEQSGEVKHVVEVNYRRRDRHQPDAPGAPPEPGGDQG